MNIGKFIGTVLAIGIAGLIRVQAQTNSTQQILHRQSFREGMVLTGTNQPTEAENKELLEVLTHLQEPWWTSGIEQFLHDYPNSPWAASLHYDYASFCRRTGRTTKALDNFEAAWALVKSNADPQSQRLGGAILGSWTDLLSSLGRLEKLKELIAVGNQWNFANPRDRDMFQGAKDSYYLMRDHPGIAFRCGTFALKSVGEELQPTNRALERLVEIPSPTNGFSMANLMDLARKYGLNLEAVRRTAGEKLIVPSVVHWRQNHYAAILQQQGDLYLVSDPTFRESIWMPADVINDEASGEFLVPAQSQPKSWTRLARNDMEKIHGMGLPNNINDAKDKGCHASFGSSPQCSSCKGMPIWSVSEPYINLWLQDEPMSYLTSRGESFPFQTSYKQRDTRQVAVNADQFLANNWNNSWFSYLTVYGSQPCEQIGGCTVANWGTVTLYLPNGGAVDFSHGLYDQETRLQLQTRVGGIKLGPDTGANGAQVVHADGSVDIYGLITGGLTAYQDIPQNDYLLTEHIDAHGNTEWFMYGSTNFNYILQQVIDYNGLTNTLIYNSSAMLLKVVNPYGLTAQFKYDSHNNLTNITDAQGLSSSITYDTNNYPTSLVTPYGTTKFSLANNGVSYGYGNAGGDDNGLIDRSALVVDPTGATNLYMYRYDAQMVMPSSTFTGVPTNTPFGTLDTGSGTNAGANSAVWFRNSFYWSPLQYAHLSTQNMTNLTQNDYLLARMQHWLQDTNELYVTEYISVGRDPSPDGINPGLLTFYDYQGKTVNDQAGTYALPSVKAWQLPDGETHYEYLQFDTFGNIIDDIATYTLAGGSVGTRTNQFIYANNTYTATIGSWSGSGLYNTASSSYTIPNLLSQIIGADGNPIWSYGGFDTVSITNYFVDFNGLDYQTNGLITSWDRVLPDYATNGVGQIAQTTYTPASQATVVMYDATNAFYPANAWLGMDEIASYTSVTGLTTTNVHNAGGFLTQTIDLQIGRTNSVSYTTNGVPNTFTNELGLAFGITWDALLRQTSISFPDGTYISNRYNNLDLVGVRDRLGNWTTYGYDDDRRLIEATNANSAVTTYDYCTCGALTAIIDALTNVTTLNYDYQGNLTNADFADGTVLNYKYDSTERPISMADGLNHSLQLAYNNQGLIIAVSNGFGAIQRTTFDIRDRQSAVTDANGVTVSNTFDNLDRILTTTWPDGISEGFGYSPQGLAFYTNRDQQISSYGRDVATRRISVTNGNLEVTRYAYDPASDVIAMTNGLGHSTVWQYNAFGWLTNKVDGISRNAMRLAYNLNGWPTNRWTPEKGNTVYTYDNVGNLLSIAYPNLTNTYAYDALNRLTNMVDAVGTNSFSYTEIGQLASETGPWPNDTVAYTYSQGLRTILNLSEPNGSWVQTNNYDSAWRMTSVVSPVGTFNYTYNFQPASSLVSGISLPNGAGIANSYDTLARLTQTIFTNHWGHALDGYTYGLDSFGLRTNVLRNLGLTSSSVSVGYDRIGQLTKWTGKETNGASRLNEQFDFGFDAADNLQFRTNGALSQTFTVDAANELTNVSRSGTFTLSGAMPAPATNIIVNGETAQSYRDFTFAATNLLLTNGANTFTIAATNVYGVPTNAILALNLPQSVNLAFDNNGNLTNDGTRTFAYDSENQLTNVTVAGQWRSDFIYDGLNRRRITRDFGWNGSTWTKTNEVRYIYDGNVIIQERDTNNNVLVTYTRGIDLSHSLLGAGGIDGLLARTDPNGSTFYHSDANGNITALMDRNEDIVARYLYGPFGKLVGQWGSMATANTMQFSSMPQHDGLAFYPFRAYEPNFQRWMNQDPIQESGGLNLYAYAQNSPANLIDPFGLFSPLPVAPPPALIPTVAPAAAGGGAAVAGGVSVALLSAVVVGSLADAALLTYDAYQAGQVANLNNQTAQANQDEQQKKADYDAYHKRCDEPPPKGLTPCDLAKWKLQKAKDCKKLRTDFANKYYSGTFAKHEQVMKDLDTQINNLENWINKYCKPNTQ